MSLAALFASLGTTGEAAAARLPFAVDPALFDRVDARRQPLPADVARALAALLGVDLGTVRGAAGLVTEATGETVRRPLPPDPFLGDKLVPPQLAPYQVARPISAAVSMLWAFGGGAHGIAETWAFGGGGQGPAP